MLLAHIIAVSTRPEREIVEKYVPAEFERRKIAQLKQLGFETVFTYRIFHGTREQMQ